MNLTIEVYLKNKCNLKENILLGIHVNIVQFKRETHFYRTLITCQEVLGIEQCLKGFSSIDREHKPLVSKRIQ